jgi:hypothetical protein
MQDLASLAAAGKPLDQRAAARRADTHEVNVSRALKKLKSSGAWTELVKSAGETAPLATPVAAPTPVDAAPDAAPAPLTPISTVIERGSDRPGDGRQRGHHGTRGAHREGVKVMSDRLSKGLVTPNSCMVSSHQRVRTGNPG